MGRKIPKNPLHGRVAAVSVGIYRGEPVLDLDYAEDSEAETDMNIVMNEVGNFVEVQGTAEGHAFTRDEFDAMLDLAADVALFVGQEVVEIAVSVDERFAFEAGQRGLDLLAERQLVGIDLVHV